MSTGPGMKLAPKIEGRAIDHSERLHHLFEKRCDQSPEHLAIDAEEGQLTYRELDEHANQLASLLLTNGIKPGFRVGIHLERSLDTYISLLAALKVYGVFVPLDESLPQARKKYIAEDAALDAIITTSNLASEFPDAPCEQILLDVLRSDSEKQSKGRLSVERLPQNHNDDACYIIYTSGTTGKPKGVCVEHHSICNFVKVASQTYGYRPKDRVYQGMTIAADFSIEEIWVPLIAGATIVPSTSDHPSVGPDLAKWLIDKKISVLCCVPTLLATLDRDIPSLRLLIAGGEDCPADLVMRWSKRGRRMLNTYGPTETTVDATYGELVPNKRITIGKPLPTYSVYILDEKQTPVKKGEAGEIWVGGQGVARGYINRDDLTRACFLPDPFAEKLGQESRMYRTGDLGRLTDEGEIEFLGRTDTQVKIRGYRIELAAIESVILSFQEVESAVVNPWESLPGMPELVAYCKLKRGVSKLPLEQVHTAIREKLPSYMVPAYIDVLEEMPTLPNGKVDRKHLPAPKTQRVTRVNRDFITPRGEFEEKVAAAFAEVLRLENVSAEDDFLMDLGGHSLAAGQLVSILRKDQKMAHASLADVYSYPTVKKLAEYLATGQGAERSARARAAKELEFVPGDAERVIRQASDREYRLAGFFQILFWYVNVGLLAAPGVYIIHWLIEHTARLQERPLVMTGTLGGALLLWLLYALMLPIVAKWLVLGQVKPGKYPLWQGYFLRWWLCQNLFSLAPRVFLSGTPLLPFYYRLFGARVGNNCHMMTATIFAFDLLDIGNNTTIGVNTHLYDYQVMDGMLHLGKITIGSDCYVGSNSVIQPNTAIGDRAWLGDQSLLSEGTQIPESESWCGSPAGPEEQPNPEVSELAQAAQQRRDTLPGILLGILGMMLALPVPTLLGFAAMIPGFVVFVSIEAHYGALGVLAAAPVAGLIFVFATSLVVIGAKQLMLHSINEGIYPIFRQIYWRKWIVDSLMRMHLGALNSMYSTLYLPPFLRLLGVKVGARSEISTITRVTPNLLEIGDESFIADAAHVGTARSYRGLFSVKPTRIDNRAFVGNAAFVPGNVSIEENSLVGVLSVPPGKIVEKGTTWLGSPPIRLLRRQPSQEFPESLTFKPTRFLYLARLLFEYFRVTLPATLAYLTIGLSVNVLAALLDSLSLGSALMLSPGIFFLACLLLLVIVWGLKKLVVGCYQPRVEPLWSIFVRRTELITGIYETIVAPFLRMFAGTPLAPWILRIMGAKVGRRCFIETSFVTEFDLVTIGDDCCIGRSVSLQTHLFEDRVMKMSHVRIGDRCSIGPRAIVLYDSVLEDDVLLSGLSLVMKGEVAPRGTSWRGTPAESSL